jgi:hypothetical protein
MTRRVATDAGKMNQRDVLPPKSRKMPKSAKLIVRQDDVSGGAIAGTVLWYRD